MYTFLGPAFRSPRLSYSGIAHTHFLKINFTRHFAVDLLVNESIIELPIGASLISTQEPTVGTHRISLLGRLACHPK